MATVTTPEGVHAAEPALPVVQAPPARPAPPAQAARPGENTSVFCKDWFAVRVWALCALLIVAEFVHGLFRW